MILFVVFFTIWPVFGSTETVNGSVYYVQEYERDLVCESKICVSKCCSQWEYLQCDNLTFICKCLETDVDIDFSSVQLYSDKEYDEEVNNKFTENFAILQSFYSNLSDELRGKIISSSLLGTVKVFIGVDGKIRMENLNAYKRWDTYASDQFCVDLVDVGQLTYDKLIIIEDVLVTDKTIHVYAMFISSFFLILVLIVYAVLPGLRNLPGKILMAYVFSQLVAFMSLAMMQVVVTLPPISCEILTAIIYDSFLSSFCWMNVMSYDIFWTFRSYAKARQHRHGENFKFAMYCLYAWGVPLAMTAMMIMMHRADFSDKPWIIKPLINDRGCFLMEGQKFVYLYAPMLILIICNWLFFVLTVFNIWRVSRSTAMARSPASGNAAAHRAHKNRFLLYIKLSVVMGVNWLLEVISSLYPELNGWWVADMYNLLIGFTLFLIFIFRRKIYKDLQSKFSGIRLDRWSTTNSTITSTTDSSVSQDMSLQVSHNPRGTRRDKHIERSV